MPNQQPLQVFKLLTWICLFYPKKVFKTEHDNGLVSLIFIHGKVVE
jgi:hypothetical protein